MTTVAFVPVRGGSRGIPGKNVRPFCGRPLVYWCLRALQDARRVDRVVVATDCDRIDATVKGFELDKVRVFRRSNATSTDTASTESAMLEFLRTASGPDADADAVFVLVQATSPFTRATEFDHALERYAMGNADSMLSCARQRRFYWSTAGEPLNYDPAQRPRRQDFDGLLVENGAFYINRVGSIRTDENRLSGRIEPFEMPSHTALELDEEEDWLVGEALMRRYGADCMATPLQIRLLLTDVDGVLTDGGMYYTNTGDEMKRFNTLDGMAFELVRGRGMRTGIVTGEDTLIVTDRARKIRADYLYQGVRDKLPLVRRLCEEKGIPLSQVAYIGDDLGDLELLAAVGLSACPSTAVDAVKLTVDYVCERGGGQGCLREVVDRLLLGNPSQLRQAVAEEPVVAGRC